MSNKYGLNIPEFCRKNGIKKEISFEARLMKTQIILLKVAIFLFILSLILCTITIYAVGTIIK